METDYACWFDTGILPDINTKIEMVITPYSQTTGEYNVFFGACNSDFNESGISLRKAYTNGNTTLRFGNSFIDNKSWTLDVQHTVTIDKDTMYFDSKSYAVNAISMFSACTYTIYIGAEHNNTGAFRPSYARYGEIKIWDSNTLVADLKPVVDNNSVGFFDEVSQTFKANLGSGTPTAGPVITPISVSASTTSVGSSGGSITIDVTSDVSWSVSGNSFLTLSSTGDTGSTAITATAPSYSGDTERSETLTFTDARGNQAELTISQEAETPISTASMFIGTDEIEGAYLGEDSLDAIYMGETLVYSGGTPPPPPPIDYRSMPLTIESIDTNDLQLLSYSMSNTYSGEYSINSGAPVSFTVTSGDALTITGLSAGDKVQFTVDTDQTITNSTINYRYFSSTGTFNVYGNVMSVIYADFTSANAYDRTIADLFDSSKVVDASNLWMGDENTSITGNCFQAMFYGCTGLTAAPALPFTTLAEYCYQAMFKNCTSLTTAPELPATTLQRNCYHNMFQGCTSLTTAPVLPATSLSMEAYYQMFRGCSSLNYIKCLVTVPTTTNLYNWVNGVSATGTFVKDASASWNTGVSGIPSGWTVVDAS